MTKQLVWDTLSPTFRRRAVAATRRGRVRLFFPARGLSQPLGRYSIGFRAAQESLWSPLLNGKPQPIPKLETLEFGFCARKNVGIPVNDVGRLGRSQCELPLGPRATRSNSTRANESVET